MNKVILFDVVGTMIVWNLNLHCYLLLHNDMLMLQTSLIKAIILKPEI